MPKRNFKPFSKAKFQAQFNRLATLVNEQELEPLQRMVQQLLHHLKYNEQSAGAMRVVLAYLTRWQYNQIERLVFDEGKFASRSEVVRVAIRELIRTENIPAEGLELVRKGNTLKPDRFRFCPYCNAKIDAFRWRYGCNYFCWACGGSIYK